MENWIEHVLSGKIDFDLVNLRLETPDGAICCTGAGFATWQQESGKIRVRAQTDGGDALRTRMFSGSCPGTLIAESEKLVMTAQTRDGWDAKCDSIPVDGYHISDESSRVLWDVEIKGITLTRRQGSESTVRRVIECVLGPPPDQWPRCSARTDDNPSFGGRTISRDWLEASCGAGVVAARRRNDGWFEVQLKPNDAAVCIGALTTAVCRAFGFLAGCRVELRAYHDESCEVTTRRLQVRHRGQRSNRLYRPLGYGFTLLKHIEEVLGTLIDFFITDDGKTAAHYLELCWDTTDNWFETRITIATTSVEGLQKLVDSPQGPNHADDFSKDLGIFRSWRRQLKRVLSERFRNRLNGFVSNISSRSTSDIFREWQAGAFLDVSREDVEAWKLLRHPAAHGMHATTNINDAVFQDRLDKFARVVNLINRMTLHLAGYRGIYIDYAQSGWPEVKFPFHDTAQK